MSRPSSTDRVADKQTGRGRSPHGAGRTRKAAPSLECLEPRQLLAAAASGPAIPGDGPTVVLVQRFGFHAQPTSLVISFSQPLDPVRAENINAYHLRNFKARPIGISSAVYDPANQSVTLHARPLVALHHPTQLLVAGTGPNGLTNTAGVPLDGAFTGRPQSNFSAILRRGNLAGPASASAKS